MPSWKKVVLHGSSGSLAHLTLENLKSQSVLGTDASGNIIAGSVSGYSLPTATDSILGGIKVGGTLSITNGVLSARTYTGAIAAVPGEVLGSNGIAGYVPAATAAQYNYFLRGDGSWAVPTNTVTRLRPNTASSYLAGDFMITGSGDTTVGYSSGVFTISSTDTVYTLSAATTSSLGGIKVGTNLSIDTNGVLSSTDTTYIAFRGANASTAGTLGLVPAPAKGTQASYYLRADGTWQVPPNTTYSAATTTANGLMSSTDKSKLDGITAGANAYVLPVASSDGLGGIKIGTGLSIDENGVVSAGAGTALGIYNKDGTDYYSGNLLLEGSGATTITYDSTANKFVISSTDTDTDTNTTYSAGTGLTLSGTTFSVTANTYAPASHTHAYLPLSGGTLTGTTAGSDVLAIDGVNGRLFTVTDDLSDSLFSVNTIAGLPVIEAFADNTVKIGPFTNPVEITSTGNMTLGGNNVATQNWVTAQGYITSQTDSQTLSWDNATDTLTISSGNSVAITGFAASDHTHADATQAASGFFSSTDKKKLDGIATGANAYTLPVAGTAIGGVKSGTDITVDASGNVSVNDDSHTHDGRYYTESEVDTLLAGKQAAGTYLTSLPSHNHDDRYFTETESDSRYLKLAGGTMTGTLTAPTIVPTLFHYAYGWRKYFKVRSVGVSGGSINNKWVHLFSVEIGGSYDKALIKAKINGYDDVSIGTEVIQALYENGGSTQENHDMYWYSIDNTASLFKTVKSIRTSTSGLRNTYEVWVQMAGDWRDTFTMEVEFWEEENRDLTFGTANGQDAEPSGDANDITKTSRQWAVNSNLYIGGNITLAGTVDGRDIAADGTKLDGIASGANNYSLPVAGTSIGGVKSGTDITVDASGNVSVNDDSHTHDGRYYTESEIDTKLAAKAASSHTHAASDITSGTLDLARIPEWLEEKYIYSSNDDNGVYMPMVKGGMYATQTPSITGAIKVTLPAYQSNMMFTIYVDIYEYTTGETVTLRVSGYAYSDAGATWHNCSVVNLADNSDRDYTVRFYSDTANSRQYFTIGETTSAWSYPQVMLRDFWGGYQTSEAEAQGTWRVEFVTSFDGDLRHTFSGNLVAADWDNIRDKPTTFSPSAHTHDDRYYTETETDTLLAGKAASTHSHSDATQAASGFFSSTDKKKLDGIEAGANNYTYTLPVATSSVLGGVKQGTNVSIAADGTISSTDTNTWRPIGTGATDAAAGNHTHALTDITGIPGWFNLGNNMIANLSNFNASVPSGFYQYSGASNAPGASWYNLINVRHSNTANDHGFQIAASYYDENIWTRTYQSGTGRDDGTFTTWRSLVHSGNIGSQSVNYAATAGSAPASDVYAWAKAAAKPTYTNSEVGAAAASHAHAIADVTGLQTALDGKAASSHTHNYVATQGNYVWRNDTLAGSYTTGIQTSFVRGADGFPDYGAVLHVGARGGNDAGGDFQIYSGHGSANGGNYLRVRNADNNADPSDSWTSWRTIWDSGNFNPDSKAAASHTHAISDVTGLQTALDGKSGTSHTHDDRYYTESESDARYLRKGTEFNANYTKAGYGYWNGVAQTYWWKVCTLVADGSYKDYNVHLDWTSRYASGELLLHVHTDADTIIDVFDDYVMQKTQDYGKAITDFVWIKTNQSTLEIWVATPAWQEFDYFIRSNVNEGAPVVTYYSQGEVEPTTSKPDGSTTFNEHKWNTAYGWGNHADAGYLKTYTDTNTVTSVGVTGDLSTGNVIIAGSGATTVTKSGGTITISSTDTDTTYSAATTERAGLMSSTDKSKLDGIAASANNYTYTLPVATSSVLGGVKQGTNTSIAADGTISSTDTNTWRPLGTGATDAAAGNHTHDDRYYTESEVDTLLAGKLSTTGKAADAETVDGIDSSRIVYGANERRSTRYDGEGIVSRNQNSGFYYGYDPDGGPYTEWWNWLTVAGASWTSSNNYDFKLAHNFHGDDLYVSRMTNGTQYSWRKIIDSANIGSYALTSLPSHTHDDRYYTESEVDTLLAGKQASGTYAAASHTHGIGSISDATRWWNNFGDNHTTRTTFDATGTSLSTGFGWRYIQGSTNGPGTSTSPNQYYGLTVGLGNDYDYNTYGMQLVIPRNTATPYISVRFEENRVLGAWQKISAGYADSAGSVAWDNVSGKPTTFTPSSHTHDDRYYTESEIDTKLAAKGPVIPVTADGQDDGHIVSMSVDTEQGTMTFRTSTSNTYVATLFK